MNNKTKSNYLKKIIESIRENKKVQYAILIGLISLALIVFAFGYNNKKTERTVNTDFVTNYVDNLENKLSSVLSKVSGAGKVSVVITVESGMETVLAMKTTTKEDVNGKIESDTTPIVINGKTVVVKELYPKIVGVLIVADGAKNISVMSRLQQATVSLLNININQIEILSA